MQNKLKMSFLISVKSDLKNLMKDKTCFKNRNKSTFIDLPLTNSPKCF